MVTDISSYFADFHFHRSGLTVNMFTGVSRENVKSRSTSISRRVKLLLHFFHNNSQPLNALGDLVFILP